MTDSCRLFSGFRGLTPEEGNQLLDATHTRSGALDPVRVHGKDQAIGLEALKEIEVREEDFNGDGSGADYLYVTEDFDFYNGQLQNWLFYRERCGDEDSKLAENPVALGANHIEQYFISDFNKDNSRDIAFQPTDGSLIVFFGLNPKLCGVPTLENVVKDN